MNEDDTFRKLKRPSHSEMRALWVSSELFKYQVSNPTGPNRHNEVIEFFEGRGWSLIEYSNGFKTRPNTHD